MLMIWGEGYFVETDVEAYGACHKEVVVASLSGAKRAVWLFLVVQIFVDASAVAVVSHKGIAFDYKG